MRLLFTKEGVAVWASHLDLMRALMRSFRRAGIDLMPLSVGVRVNAKLPNFHWPRAAKFPLRRLQAG